jgi:hypothetical protein
VKRVLSWVLGSVLGFATFYVVYAHLASILTAKRYRELPDVESFTSESELARDWTIRKEGAVAYAIEGGELHVSGRGTFLELASERRSLEEARITLRFKVRSTGAYDVLLALEEGEHRIAYGLRNEEAAPGYAWDGDPLHVMPGIRGRGLPGEELDEKGRHPFKMDGEWHEITLAVSTTLHRIAAFVDGVPTGTVLAEWIGGMPVRVVFGVRAREPDQPLDVSFAKVVYEPRPPEAQSLDFTDGFDGKVIDPRRWAVHSFSSDLLSVALKPTPRGLRATGQATPLIVQPAPAFMIDTPSFPLSSAYVRTVVEARELHRAAFFVGITSALGGPHLRFFDAGFHGDERVSTVAGHWGRDAQVRFEGSGHRASSDVVTLEIELDAKTRIARAKMDGRVIGEHVSDLQPREHVRVRFGVVLDDAEGHFDVTVRELRLRALGD